MVKPILESRHFTKFSVGVAGRIWLLDQAAHKLGTLTWAVLHILSGDLSGDQDAEECRSTSYRSTCYGKCGASNRAGKNSRVIRGYRPLVLGFISDSNPCRPDRRAGSRCLSIT